MTIKSLIDNVNDVYNKNSYDFTKFKIINKKQNEKIRHTRSFAVFSCEETLCIYLKKILDRNFHIKYPNRNDYIHSLFDMTSALHNMNDFSIIKFDFENFFNTVSSEYVFKKYVLKSSLERFQIALFERFVENTKYAYAGFNTSNVLCEIIAKHFDEILSLKFKDYGLIFYRRYIDDGILIFNRHVNEDLCLSIIRRTIQDVFFDNSVDVKYKCKTCLNNAKTKYISARKLLETNSSYDFDFLGYQFVLSSKCEKSGKIETTFKYGITQKKIDKYSQRISDLVKDYKNDKNKNIELLRHQIKAFACRAVYRLIKYKSLIWKAKGFVSNYQELRYRLDCLTNETEQFLKNAIIDAFKKNKIELPYFLKGKKEESIYNLYNNLKKYRTLLFVEQIGIDKKTLDKMCKQIEITVTNRNYNELVRDYLIKVKVGH